MTIERRAHLLALLLPISFVAGAAQAQAQTAAAPAPVAPPTAPPWESSVAAGLTLTRGNSDTLLASVLEETHKKWAHDELNFGAGITYGETKLPGATNSTVNANTGNGFIQYNHLFNERLYGYAHADAMYDDLADVKYRVSLSPGAGYYFIKDKRKDLSAEIGPGYVIQRLGTANSSFATLRAGEKFHLEISDRARCWETVDVSPQVDKFSNYIVNAEVGIEGDLTQDKKMRLRCTLQDTYNNQPATDREKNDTKLITSIVYKF